MKQMWFKKPGWTCLLYHALDAAIAVLAIVLLISFYITIVRNGPPVPDDLYEMLLYTYPAFW